MYITLQSLDEFQGTKDVILEEREEMLSAEQEGSDAVKTKVIDNATNMTEVDMSFEIEEIEVKIAQVLALYFVFDRNMQK